MEFKDVSQPTEDHVIPGTIQAPKSSHKWATVSLAGAFTKKTGNESFKVL